MLLSSPLRWLLMYTRLNRLHHWSLMKDCLWYRIDRINWNGWSRTHPAFGFFPGLRISGLSLEPN